LVRYSGGAIRDDGAILRTIAALGEAWYSQERSEATISIASLKFDYPAGCFLYEIGSSESTIETNALVTQRVWNFADNTTTIRTGYSELDLAGFVDFPGLSDPKAVARHIIDQDRRMDELEEHVGNLPVRMPTAPGRSPAVPESICRLKGSYYSSPAGGHASIIYTTIVEDTANEALDILNHGYRWRAAAPGVVVVTATATLANQYAGALDYVTKAELFISGVRQDVAWEDRTTGAGGARSHKLSAIVSVDADDIIEVRVTADMIADDNDYNNTLNVLRFGPVAGS
jgi:hypothetical protein